MTKDELITKAEQILSAFVKGKKVTDLIPVEDIPSDMVSFGKCFNEFISSITECHSFAVSLASGDLGASPPPRANCSAGHLKELHSQLMSMSHSMKDLSDGKMVSKLYYPGELFENYNKLISMVSDMMKGIDLTTSSKHVSSWSYHQILAAINQLTTMVLQYDKQGDLVFANITAKKALSNIEKLFKTDKPLQDDLMSYLGKFISIINRLKPHERLGPRSRFPIVKELHDRKNNRWYTVHTDVTNLTDGNIGVIHMIEDVSEWKYSEQELMNEASKDPLTSVYTRKIGDKKLQEMIDTRKVSDNCVAFVDMDELKRINDIYGHTEGDFALKTLANLLVTTVRDTDCVARYGGDEFLILFKDCMEYNARNIISRMYELLDEINISIDKPYEIQFSAGFTSIKKDMDDVQSIIDIVDEDMYKNKEQRKRARAKAMDNDA